LLAAFAVAGCASPLASRSSNPAPSAQATVVAVRATDFAFHPAQLTLRAGVPVRLELTNEGKIEHDILFRNLKATGIRLPRGQHMHGEHLAAHAEPGKMAWVEFTPTEPGTYEVFCSVLGHKEAGMVGTLIVE
jgi:uncharacterized cupredoxin-like copper-binding protein